MTQVITAQGFVEDIFAGTPVPDMDGYEDGPALRLAPDTDPTGLSAHFARLDLIVIPFETHADGRGFSLAAMLRVLGYKGHLRASGALLVDQLRAAVRAGFDDIEISAPQADRNPEPQWQAVRFGQSYQSRLMPETPR